MTKVCITLPTIEQVEFSFTPESEYSPIKGNAIASGDDAFDKEVEDAIWQDYEVNGNIWAWCTVKCTAKYRSFKGVSYLGCCSYKSEKDFIEQGTGDDMKEWAFEDLIKQIQAIADADDTAG